MRHTQSFPNEGEARYFAENLKSPYGHEEVTVYHSPAIAVLDKPETWNVSWIQWTE